MVVEVVIAARFDVLDSGCILLNIVVKVVATQILRVHVILFT